MCGSTPPVNFLRGHGLNVVRRPRSGIAVYDLFEEHQKSLRPLNGSLTHRLQSDRAKELPPPVPDEIVAGFSGQSFEQVDRSLGLELLAAAFPPYKGKLALAYQRANDFSFLFEECRRTSVDIGGAEFALDAFDSNEFATGMAHRATAGRLFIVTGALEATTIVVTAKDARQRSVEVEAGVIAMGQGDFEAKRRSDHGSAMEYRAPEPLIFAIEARQLVFVDGRFRELRPADDRLVSYGGVEDAVERLERDHAGRVLSEDLLISVAP